MDLCPNPYFRYDIFTPSCVKLIPSSFKKSSEFKDINGLWIALIFQPRINTRRTIHVKLAAQNPDV